MVYGKAEAKKKLGVLTEKNGAFLVSVEKLEEVLTMKSYAAAARDAKRQKAKITEYIAKFVYEELEFDLQESLTEQCGEFEATKKLMIDIKKIKSVQDAISSIKVIASLSHVLSFSLSPFLSIFIFLFLSFSPPGGLPPNITSYPHGQRDSKI